MKIISETSSLFTVEEGREKGIEIIPLCVTINGKTYREITEIQSDEFMKLIEQGDFPSSSQPPIGEIEEVYLSCKEEGCIHICMADGLSGTYQSCLSAKGMIEDNEKITVVNSKTLCGPHRAIVNLAAKMNQEGRTKEEILNKIKRMADSSISFLIPNDFDYLKRGGRISAIAAKMGGLLHLIPVIILSQDGRTLEKFAVKRTFIQAITQIGNHFSKAYDRFDNIEISISHAGSLQLAKTAADKIKEILPQVQIRFYELTPSFITQGGPGCIAIQSVQLSD